MLFRSAAREFSFRQVDDLLSAVGHGRITPRQVLRKLLPKEEQKKEELKAEDRKTQAAPAKKDPANAIAIRGVDGVLTRYAQCCNPLPGDPIIGYISRGLGVTIHTQDCPNVANMEMDRLTQPATCTQCNDNHADHARPARTGDTASFSARRG